MPSDIVGTYSLPSGYLAVAGTTILTTQHNPIFQDVAQGLTDRIMANGAKAMTAELPLAGNPVTALGAAPKQYVDAQALAAVAALDIKPSVVAATTANITLSAPQTIDGVSVVAADRVLVKNQTTPAENGIYIVGSGAWSRAADMAAWTNVPGAIVAIEGGTQWQDTLWLCTPAAGGTLGTTAMPWRRFDTNVLRNTQTGTSYTITTDDHNRHITFNNASPVAVTLPQATTNFGFGFNFTVENLGAGLVTITPTTSTINGAATLIVATNEVYKTTSDGANYRSLSYGPAYARMNALAQDTVPDVTADFVVTGDASATGVKKVLLGAIGPALPGVSNLLIVNGGATTNVTVTYDQAVLVTSAGFGLAHRSGSFTCDFSVNGALNRLDTGTIAANTEYHIHLIARSDGTGVGTLGSLSPTAPTLPSGYASGFSVRIGCFITGAASTFLRIRQVGRRSQYVVAAGTTVTTPVSFTVSTNASKTALTAAGATGAGNASRVPSTASSIFVVGSQNGSTNASIFVFPNNDAGYTTAIGAHLGGTTGTGSGSQGGFMSEIILESTSIFYISANNAAGANAALICAGWADRVNAS